ncbi:MAG: HlyD family efflux transporter periplasmic adaptor subunit [Bacteroidetes bacterium]|jgi:cobalt-zinc-cadmium efflux system membrane fusion protein|nr:HlyD family efflux transporter periplasmic adaptor subunit [Bacteroidota bacterium]
MHIIMYRMLKKPPMKYTMNRFSIFLIPFLILSACGNDSGDDSTAVDPGVPPSLSGIDQQAIVELTDQQADELNIDHYTVSMARFSFEIGAPGQVYGAPERISVVSAPINGRIARIYVHEGEAVQQGEPLLELESLEFSNLVADYLEAKAEIAYQEQQVDRLRVLTDQRISPQRTLDRAQADLYRAQTNLSASIARLRAVGLSDEIMQQWDPRTSDPNSTLTIQAPISGVLNRHLIELGESVNAYEELLDIIDNTEVLVRGFVSPNDAPFIRAGSRVYISERSGGEQSTMRQIEAEVTSVNPALDETNKSIVLNTIVPTQNGWPIVGQNVQMRYMAEPNGGMMSIPLNAVQYDGSDATVFVRTSPNTYAKRRIFISRLTEESAIIESGLEEGEQIATTQVFSLKALERFERYAD